MEQEEFYLVFDYFFPTKYYFIIRLSMSYDNLRDKLM